MNGSRQPRPTRAFRAVAHLAQFPRSGWIVPEIRHDDVREVILQSYRIIYPVRPDEIEILTIRSWIDSSVPSEAEDTVRWIR